MKNSIKLSFKNDVGVVAWCELELLDRDTSNNPIYCNWCFYCDELLYRHKYLRDLLNISKSYFDFVKKALITIIYRYVLNNYDIDFIIGDHCYHLRDFFDYGNRRNLYYSVVDFVDFLFDTLINHSLAMEE